MSSKATCLAMAGVFVVLGPNTLLAAQHDMPPGMTHDQHMSQMKKQAEMKQRGNVAMGFDQEKTTHHFLLSRDGGSIQVDANDESDTASRDAIRGALSQQTLNTAG